MSTQHYTDPTTGVIDIQKKHEYEKMVEQQRREAAIQNFKELDPIITLYCISLGTEIYKTQYLEVEYPMLDSNAEIDPFRGMTEKECKHFANKSVNIADKLKFLCAYGVDGKGLTYKRDKQALIDIFEPGKVGGRYKYMQIIEQSFKIYDYRFFEKMLYAYEARLMGLSK